MADYTYTGTYPVDFIQLCANGASLTLNPGDVVSLDVAPDSPDFVPVVKASKSAPTIPAVDGSDLAPEEK